MLTSTATANTHMKKTSPQKNNMKYPTKKKILAEKPEISMLTIEMVKLWKKIALPGWKKDNQLIQFNKLQNLILLVTGTEGKPVPIVMHGHVNALLDGKIILLDMNKLSIISTLHETAHYLFGPSELTACRWSIHLFKTCFPKQFEKLDWKGHLLIKQ